MLRIRKALIVATAGVLLSTLLAPASAAPLKTDLMVYFERLRGMYAEAEVTGRFYDWRSVSMYRSHAGMHLGYDIALNAGRAVPAGWPGRVTGIIPWTSSEWGVQVQLANGYYVTYGHITPSVKEGQVVMAGMTVGLVCRDHVDIKVRSNAGGYFDFGLSYGVLDGGSWSPGLGLLPPPPYENGGYRPSGLGADGLLDRYREARTREEGARAERDRARELVSLLSAYIDQESKGLPEAESHMLAYYRAADRNQISEAQAEAHSLMVKSRRTKVNRLIYVLEERQRLLREREAAFQAATARTAALRKDLEGSSVDAGRLAKIDEAAASGTRRSTTTVESNADIAQRAEEARRRATAARERYRAGGLAQGAMDEAVRTYERMRLVQVLWEQGDRDAARSLNF